MNRRDFFKKGVLGAAALAASPLFPELPPPLSDHAPLRPGYVGVHSDVTITIAVRGTQKLLGIKADDSPIFFRQISVNGVAQAFAPLEVAPGQELYLTIVNTHHTPQNFHVQADWSFNGEQL